ncbi:hypothetical protein ALC62_06269 [Cyphomyrmex costatus]|uniref:Uncharacterized protein n=1 Tax=Cyphomyrmex costatus TaxID=456900 RepID=A0A151IJG6_9HYME|nr:hypothetical protein ALC62_06269 [Cyphomyrmex costatus]
MRQRRHKRRLTPLAPCGYVSVRYVILLYVVNSSGKWSNETEISILFQKKGFHSVILQSVCNNRKLFIDISTYVYLLSQFLVVPFKDNSHLSQEQIRYNKKLSSIRSKIEMTYKKENLES